MFNENYPETLRIHSENIRMLRRVWILDKGFTNSKLFR